MSARVLCHIGHETTNFDEAHAPLSRHAEELPGESSEGSRPERQTATPLIDMFFMELYHGAAEDLPENTHTHDVDAYIDKYHEECTVHCPDATSIADLFNCGKHRKK